MADRIRGTNQPHETQLRLEPHRTHRHQRSPNLVRTWRLRPQPCQNRHPRSVKRPPTLLTAPHQQFRLRAPPQSRVFQVEVATRTRFGFRCPRWDSNPHWRGFALNGRKGRATRREARTSLLVQVVLTAIVALVVGLTGLLGGSRRTRSQPKTIKTRSTRIEQKTSIVNTLLRAVRWP